MNKHAKTMLLAILALTVVVGTTIAFLVSSTDNVVNKFTLTAGDDITGEIVEDWDEEDGKDLLPGAEVEKRVKLKNTSSLDLAADKATMYGGLQIWWDKVDAAGVATPMTETEYALFESIMELTGFNNVEWQVVRDNPKNGSIYIYNSLIDRGQETLPLFEGVSISSDLDNEIAAQILAFAPGGFNIRIEGVIVQGQNVTINEAAEQIENKFDDMATP